MAAVALEGVTVLDVSTGVAGPYCTRLLAGLGARVVKVEPPGGDPARRMWPFLSDASGLEHSALFHHLNGGKKSVVLNLHVPSERATLRSLVQRSQVLVESFPPGTMAALDLGYSTLARYEPSVVFTSITDFGQTGPYKDFRATELIHQALGGILYTSGDLDREPVKLPGYQACYLAGLNASVATLAALYEAERTGLGGHVDVSIMEAVVSALEATTVTFAEERRIRRRQGNRHGRDHPMTVLPCQDGYAGVMIGGDADWELLALLTGLEELANQRFANAAGRLAHADEIDVLLGPWLMAHRRHELFRAAQELRLPFAMVLSPEEVLRDEQHRQRGFFSRVQHPVAGRVTQVGAPFVLHETPWCTERAPVLGEHTREIHGSLTRSCQRETAPQGGCTPRADVATDQPSASAGVPLDGVRVLDLTAVWAGPYCTRILADLGAEVVKIEPPFRPDGTRSNPGYFQWLNRNKLGLTLDLANPEGKDVFRHMVRISDVVVENFSPRVMPNLGLDYAALSTVRPDLIMLSMPAYGSSGPYRDYVAYGPGIEAMSGLSWMAGYAGGPPLLSGAALADPTAGLHGAVAILAALRHRQRTGRGQSIDLAQRESLSQTIGEALVLAGQGRAVPPRDGNRHPMLAPHGCYRCAGDDRWVAIAVTDDDDWRRLCRAMDSAALADDRLFRTLADRKDNEAELNRLIESWTLERDPLEVMRALQTAGVAAGAVADGEMLSRDEHLAVRGLFVQVPAGEREKYPCPGLPWRTSETPPCAPRPAPRQGQHNRQILGELLGLDEQRIRQLEVGGVIGSEL